MRNLEMFMQRYKRVGSYGILPIHYVNEYHKPESSVNNLMIIKTQLSMKPAWQINENSNEIVAVTKDDDLIIPEEINPKDILKKFKKVQDF